MVRVDLQSQAIGLVAVESTWPALSRKYTPVSAHSWKPTSQCGYAQSRSDPPLHNIFENNSKADHVWCRTDWRFCMMVYDANQYWHMCIFCRGTDSPIPWCTKSKVSRCSCLLTFVGTKTMVRNLLGILQMYNNPNEQ